MKRLYGIIMRVISTLAFPLTGLILHGSHRVRVVIRYKDEVLLQRTSVGNQRWGFPGGGVDKGESPIEAAMREVKEEVGLSLSGHQLVDIQSVPAAATKWPAAEYTFFEVVLDQKVEPHISRPLEILDAKWFKIDELSEQTSDSTLTVLSGQKIANR